MFFCFLSIIVRDGGHVAVVVILQYVNSTVLAAARALWYIFPGGLAVVSVCLSVCDSTLVFLSRAPAASLVTPGPKYGGTRRV